MQVIHLTGHLNWEVLDEQAQQLPADLAKNYQAFPYLHEMGAAFAAADLIVSRAGASTLGEYPLFGLPAILVPYPYAWRYQKVNASFLEDHGAAVLLRDEEMDEKLLGLVMDLITDRKRLAKMSQAMTRLATPEAAFKIAALVNEMAETPEREGNA